MTTPTLTQRVRTLMAKLPQGLPEKEEVLKLCLLSFLSGESVFLLGPPGVAKSLVARRLKFAFQNARAFEYLMGRFSTPEEIFGPLSIAGLRDRDVFERRTQGYLPEADVVFLDEIWRASPPIQNALLTVLNEKVFRNGNTEQAVPLKGFIGASNRIPENDETAEAFWDRFLVRLEVKNVLQPESFLQILVDQGDLYSNPLTPGEELTQEEYLQFQASLSQVVLPEDVRTTLLALRDRFAALGSSESSPTTASVYVSDRRWKKAVRFLKACALVHGRGEVVVQDLFLLHHCFWNHPSHRPLVGDLITSVIQETGVKAPVDLIRLEEAYLALHKDLVNLVRESQEQEVLVPQLFQQEYYTVNGFRPSVLTRIWAEDFDLLSDGQARECEVYFFAKGYTYSFSEKHMLKRTGPGVEILVDGQSFLLEAQKVKQTVVKDRTADGPEMEAWEQKARSLAGTLEHHQTDIKNFRQVTLEKGADHLFVPASRVPATLQNLDGVLQKLADLRLKVQRLISLKKPETEL